MASNIETELEKIKNGHYGSDIRMAIHDAIEKLNVAIGKIDEETPTYTRLGAIGIAEFQEVN